MAEHAETLAQIESLNQGKSIHVARMIDAGGSVEFMRYMAGWATKIEGRTMDVSIAMPPGSRRTRGTPGQSQASSTGSPGRTSLGSART